jgi:hypothetical protein
VTFGPRLCVPTEWNRGDLAAVFRNPFRIEYSLFHLIEKSLFREFHGYVPKCERGNGKFYAFKVLDREFQQRITWMLVKEPGTRILRRNALENTSSA